MPNTAPAAGEAMPIDKKLTTSLHPNQLPERYVMVADGHCLEPQISDGAKLLLSRVDPYEAGDFVAIFKKPEFTVPGDHQVLIKRLIFAPRQKFWENPANHPRADVQSMVIADMFNPPQVLYFNPSHLLGIHKCLGLVPEGMKTHKVSDDWVRQQAKARTLEETF
jgi:hypothetical protein